MKATKEQADYRDGHDDMKCKNCTMFKPPASCTSVQGKISTQALCDYFRHK